ncbi:Bacteriophage abortive infection AbiH [Enterococcus casseliflavus]|uniref:AbiH family protein n=1 Tax=Enterococcus casseliflavus TaxID=37734 RepID=UPI0008E68762|nr:AbiH family protein [Enterococcus casseliflavus]SFD56864.1 Bacteriophage abortive infection AbiH [Enterococcus casseliflavus]
MSSNLIILGNGFDLKCRVRSTFKDFFDDRISTEVKQQLESFFKNLDLRDSYRSLSFNEDDEYDGDYIPENRYNLIEEANLTFWDLLFVANINQTSMRDWHNVEQNMLDILKEIDLEKNYSNLGQHMTKGIPNLRRGLKSNIQISLIKCCILAYYVIPKERYRSKKNLDNFLLSELILFESAFSQYLKDQVLKTRSYFDLSELLIGEIIGVENSIDDIGALSFNYTEPKCLRNKITNVHGKLKNDNIIFGIDQDKIPTDSLSYKYTKTFRKMVQINKKNDDYVYINNKNDLKNIFFYGHSLSALDYSYFQSIFDYYNLYDSNVSLTFCCSPYSGKTSQEILAEHAGLVANLLEKYGTTMDNENHGRNLMHKLMLEGRLTIKEI